MVRTGMVGQGYGHVGWGYRGRKGRAEGGCGLNELKLCLYLQGMRSVISIPWDVTPAI